MVTRTLSVALLVTLAATGSARAALVLEYIRVLSTTAGPSAGPAISGPLLMDPTGVSAPSVVFLQVALRDTLGAGPEHGQPGTVPWQTNGGFAGYGSCGLGAFFVRFDGIPGVAVNPAPSAAVNARLVNPIDYGTVTAGSTPPNFTRIGGLLNFGSEPGAVPDPLNYNRIPLFNLRIQALAVGSGTFRLHDPNPSPTSADNALMRDPDIGGFPNPVWFQPIDDLIFGSTFTNTYDLPVIVTPEPSALALAGMAAAAFARRLRERRGIPPPG